MRIYFIRHGETDKNVAGKLHSSGDNETLNETDKKQMLMVADKLKDAGISTVYASTEKRARDSAELLSEKLRCSYRQIEGLQERNWGVYTGKPWSVVSKVLKPMSLAERYEYIPDGGESWRGFEQRLINALDMILDENDRESNVAIVTHGGAIRALMPYLLGVGREESFMYDPDNASLTIFDYDGKNFQDVVVNSTSHLK